MSIFDELQSSDFVKMLEREMEMLRQNKSLDCQHAMHEVEVRPKDAEAWFEYGLLLVQEGLRYEQLAFEKARHLYIMEHPEMDSDTTIELDLNIPELAEFHVRAIECFDKVLVLDPDYYGVQCQRGIAYANIGQYSQAEEAFLQALKDDDEDAAAAYNLAHTYRDMGKEDKASEYFELAQRLNPDDDLFDPAIEH